ncbi:MAG: S8 family serine peptidase, partial [Elusimicrobia bacterium]|nr:S8 family serine peptidase [Elusimicrobiota bacterium]
IVNAINYARTINNNPTYGRVVLNMSIGEEGTACPTAVQNAINAAVASSTGVIIVVSAGNAASTISAPANCVGVIPVGATDSNDNIASFSNTGTELASFGVVAPGVNIVTTDRGGGVTGSATGTSFSAPLVSGLAALLIAAKPTLSPTQVRDLKAQTTWDAKNDHGRFVATGVYLVLVKTDSGSQTARVAVIR